MNTQNEEEEVEEEEEEEEGREDQKCLKKIFTIKKERKKMYIEKAN